MGRRLASVPLLLSLCLALLPTIRVSAQSASLRLSDVPERWCTECSSDIIGEVSGVGNVDNYYVLLYIYSYGRWYSKPSVANAATYVFPDGFFKAQLLSTPNDAGAALIRAFLVDVSVAPSELVSAPDAPNGLQCTLPQQLSTPTITIASAVNHRGVYIGNYRAVEKHSFDAASGGWGFLDPGPNLWDAGAVEQLPNNALRLSIKFEDDTPQSRTFSAEVVLEEALGYGLYVTQVDASNMANFPDVSTTFGAFTFDHCAPPPYRELDFEMGKFGEAQRDGNAQHAVQPWQVEGNVVRYTLPPGDATLVMDWREGRAVLSTYKGRLSYPFDPTALVFQTVFEGEQVPTPGTEKWHLNLWQHLPPVVTKAERAALSVVVYDFKHFKPEQLSGLNPGGSLPPQSAPPAATPPTPPQTGPTTPAPTSASPPQSPLPSSPATVGGGPTAPAPSPAGSPQGGPTTPALPPANAPQSGSPTPTPTPATTPQSGPASPTPAPVQPPLGGPAAPPPATSPPQSGPAAPTPTPVNSPLGGPATPTPATSPPQTGPATPTPAPVNSPVGGPGAPAPTPATPPSLGGPTAPSLTPVSGPPVAGPTAPAPGPSSPPTSPTPAPSPAPFGSPPSFPPTITPTPGPTPTTAPGPVSSPPVVPAGQSLELSVTVDGPDHLKVAPNSEALTTLGEFFTTVAETDDREFDPIDVAYPVYVDIIGSPDEGGIWTGELVDIARCALADTVKVDCDKVEGTFTSQSGSAALSVRGATVEQAQAVKTALASSQAFSLSLAERIAAAGYSVPDGWSASVSKEVSTATTVLMRMTGLSPDVGKDLAAKLATAISSAPASRATLNADLAAFQLALNVATASTDLTQPVGIPSAPPTPVSPSPTAPPEEEPEDGNYVSARFALSGLDTVPVLTPDSPKSKAFLGAVSRSVSDATDAPVALGSSEFHIASALELDGVATDSLQFDDQLKAIMQCAMADVLTGIYCEDVTVEALISRRSLMSSIINIEFDVDTRDAATATAAKAEVPQVVVSNRFTDRLIALAGQQGIVIEQLFGYMSQEPDITAVGEVRVAADPSESAAVSAALQRSLSSGELLQQSDNVTITLGEVDVAVVGETGPAGTPGAYGSPPGDGGSPTTGDGVPGEGVSPAPSPDEKSSSNALVIVLVIVCVVLALVLLALVTFCWYLPRRRRLTNFSDSQHRQYIAAIGKHRAADPGGAPQVANGGSAPNATMRKGDREWPLSREVMVSVEGSPVSPHMMKYRDPVEHV